MGRILRTTQRGSQAATKLGARGPLVQTVGEGVHNSRGQRRSFGVIEHRHLHRFLGLWLCGALFVSCSSSGSGADPPAPGRGMRMAPREHPPAPSPVEPRAEAMAAPSVDAGVPQVSRQPPEAMGPGDEADRLRSSIKADGADHGARERLARLLMDRGDLPAAKAELAILLKVPSHAQTARVLRSRIHRGVGEVDAAVRWGKRAVEGGPRDPDARLHLGLALLASNERGAAISQLEEAVKLAPQRADLRQALGRALLESRKHREAVETLREAVRLLPADPAHLTLLGDAYWAGSLHREAERAYRRAINLEEGAPVYRAMALDKLGVLYHHRGMRRRAEEVLKACGQLFPHLGCPFTEVALLPANPIRIPGAAPVRRY